MEDWKLRPASDLGMPLGQRLRSPRRESGLIETAAHLGWWSLVQTYLRFYHRLRIDGIEHLLTRPPFVMVGNHASHLDALIMASPFPWRIRDRVFPVAAGDTFFESPLLTMFAAGMINALPVWRRKVGSKGLQELRHRLLDEPCGYILFPEGTRSRDGSIGTFKAGLGMLIGGTEVPVVPCHLEGAYHALPPKRSVPRFQRITMRIGEPIVFGDVPNAREGWEHIASECEAAVRQLGRQSSEPRTK